MVASAREVAFRAGTGSLRGTLTVPPQASAVVVVFSCCGHQAPPESILCARLNRQGVGTFAVDLLTSREAGERHNRRDTELLGGRINVLVGWLGRQERVQAHDIAAYATGTAAPALLQSVGNGQLEPTAVVLRNGRVDLTDGQSPQFECPLLLLCDRQNELLTRVNETVYESAGKDSEQTQFQRVERECSVKRMTDWLRKQFVAGRPPTV